MLCAHARTHTALANRTQGDLVFRTQAQVQRGNRNVAHLSRHQAARPIAPAPHAGVAMDVSPAVCQAERSCVPSQKFPRCVLRVSVPTSDIYFPQVQGSLWLR